MRLPDIRPTRCPPPPTSIHPRSPHSVGPSWLAAVPWLSRRLPSICRAAAAAARLAATVTVMATAMTTAEVATAAMIAEAATASPARLPAHTRVTRLGAGTSDTPRYRARSRCPPRRPPCPGRRIIRPTTIARNNACPPFCPCLRRSRSPPSLRAIWSSHDSRACRVSTSSTTRTRHPPNMKASATRAGLKAGAYGGRVRMGPIRFAISVVCVVFPFLLSITVRATG